MFKVNIDTINEDTGQCLTRHHSAHLTFAQAEKVRDSLQGSCDGVWIPGADNSPVALGERFPESPF
jgi:hypothetical protein